jgi:DNA-binding MarR family transcriptional regulator
MSELERCVCFQLNRASQKIRRRYREGITKYGLTHGQFFMLCAILEEEGLLPSQLADKTELDRPTATGLLDRLERDGWVERHTEPRDRRMYRIFPSAKAINSKGDFLSLFEQTNSHFVNRFAPDEWKRFQEYLSRLELP